MMLGRLWQPHRKRRNSTKRWAGRERSNTEKLLWPGGRIIEAEYVHHVASREGQVRGELPAAVEAISINASCSPHRMKI